MFRMFLRVLFNLPLRHVFGRITGLCVLVVNQAQLAALFTWCHSVQAYVEFGTVRGIGVFRMGIGDPESVLAGLLGAYEAILQTIEVG